MLSELKSFDDLGGAGTPRRYGPDCGPGDVPVPSQWRGGRRAYGDTLSPREAEVAHLAGSGRKNREIAETLFLSQRTVETHVASALRKLNADSREELADALAALARQGSVAVGSKNP